jgi:transcriptional regulator of NAD metabolism
MRTSAIVMHEKDGIVLKKLLGEERRQKLLELLKQAKEPIKGTDFAKKAGVSRQVIVGDMTLLKAMSRSLLPVKDIYI